MRGVHAHGLDFFRVSLNSLKDARLVRLIRVLDRDPRTASFWYLLRTNEPLIVRAAKAAKLDLVTLGTLADKLLPIRNRTFMHIDRDDVSEPQKLYDKAGITHAEVDRAIDGLWKTMKAVHCEVFGKDPEYDWYAGDDVRALADLRDEFLEK
jgi:HEPN superfamily AbiU2-like protein